MIFLIYYTKSAGLRIGWFSSAMFLGFSFCMFLFLFLASLLHIVTGGGRRGTTRRSGTNSPALLSWSSLQIQRFPSLVWVIFWKIYIFICIICHLISVQIWEKKTFAKVFSNSRAPSSSLVKNERGQGSLGTRSYISFNGDLRNKIA